MDKPKPDLHIPHSTESTPNPKPVNPNPTPFRPSIHSCSLSFARCSRSIASNIVGRIFDLILCLISPFWIRNLMRIGLMD